MGAAIEGGNMFGVDAEPCTQGAPAHTTPNTLALNFNPFYVNLPERKVNLLFSNFPSL